MDRVNLEGGFVVFLLICGQWSCGVPADYLTSHGLAVYDETSGVIDRADIEFVTERALEVVPYRRVDLSGSRVRLRTEPCTSLTVAGYREMTGSCLEGTVCVWATRSPCFARTAFGHELLHLIRWVKTDFEGTNAEIADLDRQLSRITIQDMCAGEDYGE